MASSTVSSWMIGSCMSVPGEKEHELHGFFGIYKSKCKWAIPSKTTKGVFINSKSNNPLTFPISSSFLSQPNRTITGFSSSNSCFLFTGSAVTRPPTKSISSAQTGKFYLYAWLMVFSCPFLYVSLKLRLVRIGDAFVILECVYSQGCMVDCYS